MFAEGKYYIEQVVEEGSINASCKHMTSYQNEDCDCHDCDSPYFIMFVCIYANIKQIIFSIFSFSLIMYPKMSLLYITIEVLLILHHII